MTLTPRLPEHMGKMALSWCDKDAIKYTDHKSVFKYISVGSVEQTRKIFESGLIDNLVAKGLLQRGTLRETGIISYPLVLEYPFIHHLSYPSEWPALALKEVALAILEIEETANRYGYTLYDPNPFNATIQNGHAVYLDYGSFVPISGTPIWSGYDKAFRDTILFPLELYEKKLHYVARLILREIVSNGLDSSTRKLADNKFQRSLLDKLVIAVSNRGEISSDRLVYRLGISGIDKILNNKLLKSVLEDATYKLRPTIKDDRITSTIGATNPRQLKVLGSRASFLKRLRRKVESLQVSEGKSYRSQYYYYRRISGDTPSGEREPDSWTIKERNIQELASKLKPKTVLDIGANIGWFSLMFARHGASVISLERDEECINQLYSYVHKEHLDVLPLVMDIRQPAPQYELNIGTVLAATERCKSELVMALAVIHHMVGEQGMTLEHLVYILDTFTEKYLLVEFVPKNEALYKLPELTEENWNVPVLKEAFGKCFDFEGIWESYPQGRQLLLFQKSGTK